MSHVAPVVPNSLCSQELDLLTLLFLYPIGRDYRGAPTYPDYAVREVESESEPETATSWVQGDPCGVGSNHSHMGSALHQTSKKLM